MRPPLDGPLEVTQLFGGNPAAEAYTTVGGHVVIGHDGIDIAASSGQAVYPAWPGVVRILESRDGAGAYIGFGLHATVTDDRGRVALYGHLSAVLVPDGARVPIHQPFAEAGSTGNSSGPHVHWRIAEAAPDRDNGYYGARDPLGGLDHDAIGRLDLSRTNL